MSIATTTLCVNDNDPPAMVGYWNEVNGYPEYVTLGVGAISLYIEPGQLDRLIGLLQEMREQRPVPEVKP